MPVNAHSSPQSIHKQAERELAAFLKAATVVLGQSDAQAGDTWLRMMEALDWPSGNHGRFFRRVTLLAIRELQISNRDQYQLSFDLHNGLDREGSRYGIVSH